MLPDVHNSISTQCVCYFRSKDTTLTQDKKDAIEKDSAHLDSEWRIHLHCQRRRWRGPGSGHRGHGGGHVGVLAG